MNKREGMKAGGGLDEVLYETIIVSKEMRHEFHKRRGKRKGKDKKRQQRRKGKRKEHYTTHPTYPTHDYCYLLLSVTYLPTLYTTLHYLLFCPPSLDEK